MGFFNINIFDKHTTHMLLRYSELFSSAGTPITRIPIMAKQPLDLYRLFKLVVERGGLVEVCYKHLMATWHVPLINQ